MESTIDPITAAVRYQRQLFAIYDEIFRRGTGDTAEAFREMNEFANSTKERASEVVSRTLSAIRDSWPALSQLYAEGADHYSRLRQIGGMKLVVGGTRHVLETQFNAIRKMVLYADTILLPDPVFPWLAKSRTAERFPFPLLLRNLKWLLLLKPLIDADLPVIPLVVFPSFELELESDDEDTKKGIDSLFVDLLSSLSRSSFRQLMTSRILRALRLIDGSRLSISTASSFRTDKKPPRHSSMVWRRTCASFGR